MTEPNTNRFYAPALIEIPPSVYSDEDLEQIAERMQKMDWELTTELAQELKEAALLFLFDKAMAHNAWRSSQKRRYMQKLLRVAEKFQGVYEELGGSDESLLYYDESPLYHIEDQ